MIRRLPPRPKLLLTDLVVLTVCWPLARLVALAEAAGLPVGTMRTDARDRFGTPLEQRFTRSQIRQMCTAAGLVDLRFSPRSPFWCVVGSRPVKTPP